MGFEPGLTAGIAWSNRSALTQQSATPRANLFDLIAVGRVIYYFLSLFIIQLIFVYLWSCKAGNPPAPPTSQGTLCMPQGLVEPCEGHKAGPCWCWAARAAPSVPKPWNFMAEDVFNVLLPLETVMDYVQQSWCITEQAGS